MDWLRLGRTGVKIAPGSRPCERHYGWNEYVGRQETSRYAPSMGSDAEAEVLRLDNAWNEAYRRHDRALLAAVLADDFDGVTPSGEPITKASLMINPPGQARSVNFSEQAVLVFGDAAISRGRIQLDLEDRRIDQRFLRVFTRRSGVWRAIGVAVTPLISAPRGMR